VTEPKLPLDYMLSVMRDPAADLARRDRMAIAAAPFVHGRIGEEAAGKREKDAVTARQRASGRYEPPAPPRLVIDNRS
jgi:phage terminase small subunit